MGKKGVEEMIDQIEIFIDSCRFQPLSSNKIIVPKDELESMIHELKLKMPTEIERCRKIMRNKEAILADARTRSDAIISESVNEANRLVDQHQITELANIRANEILDMARNQAEQIIGEATNEANEIRLGAMYYTKDKLNSMRDSFNRILNVERDNYRKLVESLESDIFTVETNMSEMEANINLLSGNIPQYTNDYQDDDIYQNNAPINNYEETEAYSNSYENVNVYGEKKSGNQSDDLLDDDEFDEFLDE